MQDAELLWQTPAGLGEGPVWDRRDGRLYWVDQLSHQIHSCDAEGADRRSWQLEESVTSMMPRSQGGFVVTRWGGFALWNPEQGGDALEPLAQVEHALPTLRFNDGKVDDCGCYWAGTMTIDYAADAGSLYRLGPDLRPQVVDSGYVVANGPTFSPDQRLLYHNDSAQRRMYVFDKDGEHLSNRRQFVEPAREHGFPDGMTTDSEGCLWVAFYGGSRVVRYAPSGEELAVVQLPASQVTSCCFGGERLDRLFITTAAQSLDAEALQQQPLAGSLFVLDPGVTGLPCGTFPG